MENSSSERIYFIFYSDCQHIYFILDSDYITKVWQDYGMNVFFTFQTTIELSEDEEKVH